MQTIPQYEIFEKSFAVAKDFDNPFVEVDFSARFAAENGKVLTIRGFYDGTELQNGHTVHAFRLRFAPPEKGLWTYETRSNCPELDHLTGTLTATDPVSHGGLQVSQTYPHSFERADKTAQFIVNDGWFPHAANGHWIHYEDVDYPQPSEADMLRFIDLLSAHGVNMIIDMSQLYARQTTITDTSFAWPWKVVDPEKNQVDCERFNLDFYRRWERTLAYCAKKDVFFAVELLFDNSTVRPLEWSHHPINKENGGWLSGDMYGLGWGPMFDVTNETHMAYTKRYIDYTLARLAPYRSVLWETGGENANLSQLPEWMLPHCSLPDEKVASWYNTWGAYIKEQDPYKRPATYGDTTYQKDMVCGPGNDWVLTQDPRNYPKNDIRKYVKAMHEDGLWYAQFNRPMVIGEMNSLNNGFYGRERRLYWTAALSGYAMGRSDRHFAIMNGDHLAESDKFPGNGPVPPIYPWLKILRDFFELHTGWPALKPDDVIVSSSEDDLLFAMKGNGEYLCYLPFGGEGVLTVDKQAYDLEILDPVSGTIETQTIEAKKETTGFRIAITCPDDKDLVYHLTERSLA